MKRDDESSLDAVFAMDVFGVVVEWSPIAFDIFGWQREEVLGRDLLDLIVPEALRDAYRSGLARDQETSDAPLLGQRLESAIRRNGEHFPIQLFFTKLQNGDAKYFLAHVRDYATKNSADVIVDYAGAMRRLGDDDELFREFVGFYDEDSKLLLATIELAIKNANAPQLQHAAHSLKGLAANLGASAVVETSSALEETGKAKAVDQAEAQLNELRHEMARLDEALRDYRV